MLIHDGLSHEKVIGNDFRAISLGKLESTSTVWCLGPILAGMASKRLLSARLNRPLILVILGAFVLHQLLEDFY